MYDVGALIMPETNVDTRSAELQDIEMLAQTNDLALNQAKSIAIVFADHRHKQQVNNQPPTLPGIACVSSIKHVTMLNSMSVAQHVPNVATACVYCTYRHCTAITTNSTSQMVNRSVPVAKLLIIILYELIKVA